jgi:hypothetical protein
MAKATAGSRRTARARSTPSVKGLSTSHVHRKVSDREEILTSTSELEARVTAIEAKIANSKYTEWAATVDARFLDVVRMLIELQRQVGVHQNCFGAIGGLLANLDGAMK